MGGGSCSPLAAMPMESLFKVTKVSTSAMIMGVRHLGITEIVIGFHSVSCFFFDIGEKHWL